MNEPRDDEIAAQADAAYNRLTFGSSPSPAPDDLTADDQAMMQRALHRSAERVSAPDDEALIERLRHLRNPKEMLETWELMDEAATRLAQLRAERDELLAIVSLFIQRLRQGVF